LAFRNCEAGQAAKKKRGAKVALQFNLKPDQKLVYRPAATEGNLCGLASTGVVVMRQMLRDLSALTWVQTKAVAWLAQCLVAGSIPSWIVLTKLDGTASPECQKSATKNKSTLG
jgi:hypothetical protein